MDEIKVTAADRLAACAVCDATNMLPCGKPDKCQRKERISAAIALAMQPEREAAARIYQRIRSLALTDGNEATNINYTTVEAREFPGGMRWCISRSGECLNKNGLWEYEPMPSSRSDAFIARTRFDSLEEAITAYEATQKGENNV